MKLSPIQKLLTGILIINLGVCSCLRKDEPLQEGKDSLEKKDPLILGVEDASDYTHLVPSTEEYWDRSV